LRSSVSPAPSPVAASADEGAIAAAMTAAIASLSSTKADGTADTAGAAEAAEAPMGFAPPGDERLHSVVPRAAATQRATASGWTRGGMHHV
jgi:hypothetical protein